MKNILPFILLAALAFPYQLDASPWGDDVLVHQGQPMGMISATTRLGGVIYAAVPSTQNPSYSVIIYKSTDLGLTWTNFSGAGPGGGVVSKLKMISNDLDSAYVFFLMNDQIYSLNVESGTAGIWNDEPVRDFDVATTYNGSLFLLVDILATNQIRRFGSFDGGATWGGSSALITSSGAHPKIYKTALSDTIIINYYGTVNADTAISTIRAARYVHSAPGIFDPVTGSFSDVVVSDGTTRKEFMSVYNLGTVWLFYTEGDALQTIKYKVSTDAGISYGIANTLASNLNINHHWFDAKHVFGSFGGNGVGIAWYSDSLQSGTATPQSDKIVYAEAGSQTPFTFSSPITISEHAPENSSLNYKPSLVTIPKATFDDIGVLWTGMDITGLNVYWDLMSFITSVNNINSESELKIYPNPASTELFIELKHLKGKINLTLTEVAGRKVKELNMDNIQSDRIRVDLNNLKNGVYFINMQTNNGISFEKLIICK